MLLNLLRFWAVFVLALHALAYVLPEETFWSVWPYTVFPPWLGVTLVAAAGTTLLPAWNRRWQSLIRRAWEAAPGKRHRRRWFAAAALLAMPLFWALRIRHLRWGDARILVDGLSCLEGPACPGGPVIYNWQAPFTVFLHQRLWALAAKPLFGWGVAEVYAAVSVACGGIFVYLALQLASELGRNTLERALVAGFLLTAGAMQLFFGYIENYTIPAVGVMVFLWLGLRVLRGEAPLWGATLALSLTNAFHPSTVVLWPAALYLAWRAHRRGRGALAVGLDVLLPPLVVAASVLTLMELGNHGLDAFLGDDRPGGGDHIWFVPLFRTTTEWQRYTMFAPAHFLDWANELLLTSVFGAFGLLVAGWRVWRRPLSASPGEPLTFLGLSAGAYLLLTFTWNADYGIRKDWDLFAPSAFVVSLLAALLWIRALREEESLAQATLLIVSVSALHTVAWVLINAFPP